MLVERTANEDDVDLPLFFPKPSYSGRFRGNNET